MISLPIIYGLLAAFLIGTSDFLSRFSAAKRSSVYPVMWVAFMGSLILWAYTSYFQDYNFAAQEAHIYFATALSGVLNVVALICLYRAIARGPVAVASPFVSSSTVFIVVIWFFMGVQPTIYNYLGMLLSVVGAITIGYFNKQKDTGHDTIHICQTAALSLIAAICFAVRLFLLQYFTEDIGADNALLQVRFFGLVAILIYALYLTFKGNIIFPTQQDFKFRQDVLIPAAQGVFETLGVLLILIASVGDYRVTVPAVFASFSIVTVTWSVLIFKEKISIGRMIGIMILISGVVIIEISS
ncbi:MAG: DMT family transporter [Pseudomonadota bacterium]